jgi:hypothetical protein
MKTLSTLLLVSAMLISAARAEVAQYEGLITFQRQGDSEKKTFPGKGIFVVDLDTYVASVLYIFPKQKSYQSADLTFRHAILAIGAGAKTTTALQIVADTPALSDVYSFVVTGKNSQLAVSDARIATTPRVYKFNFSELFYGSPSYLQIGGLLTFNSKKTLAANAQAQSPAVVTTTIANDLFDKGFSKQYP